jgi:hypothetical protein
MEPKHHHLKLCTFEVATHLGRHRRLGAHQEQRVLDLNFATTWYLAQTGEPEPQRLAEALVPASMLGYLRSGLRASRTTDELFLGAGPHPAHWWLCEQPPRGPNDETLVYRDSEVRLLGVFGDEGEVRGPVDCEWEMAVVAAAPANGAPTPGGYTLVLRCGRREVLGPYLVTPNQIPRPSEIHWIARVNGVERGGGKVGSDLKIENRALQPGDYRGSGVLGSVTLETGDVIEVEAEKIGVLRQGVGAR